MELIEIERKKYSPEQKFKIIKEQLTSKTSVSEICKKYDVSPTNFYKWQNQFLKSAFEGFKRPDSGPSKAELRKIEEQEKKILHMQAVITEVISENIDLKKRNGF